MTQPGAQPGMYPEASQATSSLIWSIIGLVCCPPSAIVGFIQAQSEMRAIDAGRRDPMNRGTASAARIIAIIAGVLWILGILLIMTLVVASVELGTLDEIREIFPVGPET